MRLSNASVVIRTRTSWEAMDLGVLLAREHRLLVMSSWAQVTLPVVELGPFRSENFRAYVNEGEMDGSLLGMDYLGQFRMEFDGRKRVLRQ